MKKLLLLAFLVGCSSPSNQESNDKSAKDLVSSIHDQMKANIICVRSSSYQCYCCNVGHLTCNYGTIASFDFIHCSYPESFGLRIYDLRK